MIRLILLEVKQLYRQFILCFVILTTIYSVVFSTYVFNAQGINQVIDMVNQNYSKQLCLDFDDVHKEDIDLLHKYEIENIWCEIDRVRRITNKDCIRIDQETILSYEESRAKFADLNRQIVEMSNKTIVDIDEYTIKSIPKRIEENRPEVWVAQSFSKKYNIKVGQVMKYVVSDQDVNTDKLEHTARSSSACFPAFQCTLSAA